MYIIIAIYHVDNISKLQLKIYGFINKLKFLYSFNCIF